MATTIQVHEKTLKQLRQLKLILKMATYDEVIRELTRQGSEKVVSRFGVHPEIPGFTRSDRLRFHEDG